MNRKIKMLFVLRCLILVCLKLLMSEVICHDLLSVLSSSNNSIVFGTCSRPNIPPNARIRFVSTEKVKFAENETIYVLCEENSFPHHVQKRTCRHGHWQGPLTRCGKASVSKIIKLEAFKCNEPGKPLLSLMLNQSDETPYPLPPNSFHFSRVPEDISLSVFGSNCYRWIIGFEEPMEIQFLLIDINIQKTDSIKDHPEIEVNVKNRNCKLEHTSYQVIQQDEIFGNYFFCDLTENFTSFFSSSSINETYDSKTDTIEVIIRTFSNRSIGLEAVFVGETYKKHLKHSNKLTTDCGKLEIQRTGVLEQVELGHILISCNDSFISVSNVKKQKFICDANGMWQGQWPICLPKKTCSKEEIIKDLDDSIQLEQIGNVYYVNETEWFAIDHTWVHYTCAHMEGIMVGKSERTCLGGKWTNKIPHCTRALHSGSVTISIIIIILIILIAVFSLIVYLSIRAHSKKIHRKLESTKSELEEKALNKQISTDYYTDIGLDTIYEDCKEIYNVPMYEMADDVRYEAEPRQLFNEPEYLTMTEGTSKNTSSTQNVNLYEYSI